MPSARKRALHEVDDNAADTPKEPSMLMRIRNMWQFANLFQWIMIFGKALKIDDNLDIEDLEAECLKHHSMVLQEIGLSLLKHLSSHRGLTHELFDEYTRRQFVAKAPERNPFGTDETPAKFADFDIYTKIRILQQMTQFVMMQPEKIREKMEEQKDVDQASWRIEPFGWDREDRTYFVLDDNRVYRLTDSPPPAPKPKKNSQKARAAARAAKRRRIVAALDSDAGDASQDDNVDNQEPAKAEDDDLGGKKWECVAVTLDEVKSFLETIRKTKDPNEKILRDGLEGHLLPILEKQEESRKRKILQREKELLALEKMAHAKRSSRIANKAEHQKMEEHVREEERKRREEAELARKEEEKRRKLEKERDNRMMSRENRLREREARRLLHEEELAQLSEDSKSTGTGRMSERRLQAEIEKNKRALQDLEEEEEDWIFDCICGAYGQIDDGTHSVACERCNIWQHSKCLGISEEEADRDDFHFICASCRRREQEHQHRPTKIKIKVKGQDASSPPTPKIISTTPIPPPRIPSSSPQLFAQIKAKPHLPAPTTKSPQPNGAAASIGNAPDGIPQPSPQKPSIPSSPPTANGGHVAGQSISTSASVSHVPPSFPNPRQSLNGQGPNPFSSPHPNLSPPDQSPNKSRAYDSIFNQSSPIVNGGRENQLQEISRLTHNGNSQNIISPLSPQAGSGIVSSNVGMIPSPSKETPTSTKTTAPVFSPHGSSPPIGLAASQPSPEKPHGILSSSMATPRLNPSQPQASFTDSSPLIPSSRGGLSPTKTSPPLQHSQLGNSTNGTNSQQTAASPTPAILPPVAALSPSPRLQDLTPPVKTAAMQQPPLYPPPEQSPAKGQSQHVSG